MNNSILTRKDLHFFLKEDGRRNDNDKGILHYWLALLFGNESAYVYRYLRALRYCEYHTNNRGYFHRIMALFYKRKLNVLGVKYGIYLPINVCGYGLRIMHLSGGGCHINAKKVGNYCGFNAGVVIGNVNHPDAKPCIGDYVAFGPGAKAFGDITIGRNVFIAPNAVVTKDILPNCIVAGIPAKLLRERELDDNPVYMKYKS